MRAFASMGLMAVTLAALAAGVVGERNPVRTRPHVAPSAAAQRFIVKLRASAAGLPAAQAPQPELKERVAALVTRNGLTLLDHRPITGLMHSVRLGPVWGEEAAATLARLRADAEVEYAVPDEQRYIHAAPNDTLYAEQWY